MIATLIPLLFAAAACLALGAIAASWLAYGGEALSLRHQLAACDPVRELRFATMTTHVRVEAAQVWRPGFSPLAERRRRPSPRSVRRFDLRAAA